MTSARSSFLLFIFVWFIGGAAFADPSSKAIALVYDDSGSMKSNQRWVAANFSIQVVSALAGKNDILYLVRMSEPERTLIFQGVRGVESLIQQLQRQPEPNAGTPYACVRTAVNALVSSNAQEKWLMVLTDGAFDSPDVQVIRDDIARAVVQQQVRVTFLLIEQQDNEVANLWANEGKAVRFDAAAPTEISQRMEEIADLLFGRSSAAGGVMAAAAGDELVISSKFPLRNLVVLRQDSQPGKLTEAISGLEALSVRQHRIVARQAMRGLPRGALVVHVAGTHVLDAGPEVIRLRFDRPTAKMRVKLLPDVAASLAVSLKDSAGALLKPDAQGIFSICTGDSAVVETRLLDDAGKPITVGRTDIGSFDVGVQVGTAAQAQVPDAGQEFFSTQLTPASEVELTGFAKYPGYFHFQAQPMRLRPGVCARDVRVTITGGLDADGKWYSEVDHVAQAPYVRVGATIDGKPVSPDVIAQWTFSGGANEFLEVRREGAEWLLRPRTACCAWAWSRATVGESQLALQLDTQRPQDKIQLPTPIRFVIAPPGSRFRLGWWYACPFVVSVLAIFLLWYLRRLLVKQRFAPQACLWVQEYRNRTILPNHLRKRASWLTRWFWPSECEGVSIDGLMIVALGRGASILVLGRSLSEHHEIDGWLFDEVRKDRGRPQSNARVGDNAEIVLLDPDNRRRGGYARRYRYSRNAADPGWQ
ncbi:MAG: vWA domain-containing protein [Panacagrimonas sp.]